MLAKSLFALLLIVALGLESAALASQARNAWPYFPQLQNGQRLNLDAVSFDGSCVQNMTSGLALPFDGVFTSINSGNSNQPASNWAGPMRNACGATPTGNGAYSQFCLTSTGYLAGALVEADNSNACTFLFEPSQSIQPVNVDGTLEISAGSCGLSGRQMTISNNVITLSDSNFKASISPQGIFQSYLDNSEALIAGAVTASGHVYAGLYFSGNNYGQPACSIVASPTSSAPVMDHPDLVVPIMPIF